jgi:hypothetical protein
MPAHDGRVAGERIKQVPADEPGGTGDEDRPTGHQ